MGTTYRNARHIFDTEGDLTSPAYEVDAGPHQCQHIWYSNDYTNVVDVGESRTTNQGVHDGSHSIHEDLQRLWRSCDAVWNAANLEGWHAAAIDSIVRLKQHLARWQGELSVNDVFDASLLVPPAFREDAEMVVREAGLRLDNLKQALERLSACMRSHDSLTRQLSTIDFEMSQLQRMQIQAAQEREGFASGAHSPPASYRWPSNRTAETFSSSSEPQHVQWFQDNWGRLYYFLAAESCMVYQNGQKVYVDVQRTAAAEDPRAQQWSCPTATVLDSRHQRHLSVPVNSQHEILPFTFQGGEYVERQQLGGPSGKHLPIPLGISDSYNASRRNESATAGAETLPKGVLDPDQKHPRRSAPPTLTTVASRQRIPPAAPAAAITRRETLRPRTRSTQTLRAIPQDLVIDLAHQSSSAELNQRYPIFYFRVKPMASSDAPMGGDDGAPRLIWDNVPTYQPLPSRKDVFVCARSGVRIARWRRDLQLFSNASLYFKNGQFWAVKRDVLAEAERVANAQNDIIEDIDWLPLRFDIHDKSRGISAVSFAGRLERLFLQRKDEKWSHRLLPAIYHHSRPRQLHDRSCGMVGELALVVALLCFSVDPVVVETFLCSLSRFQHLRLSDDPSYGAGLGWIEGRGMVVEILYDPMETTKSQLKSLETGSYGRLFV